MSGFETIGLALSAVPLAIEVLKNPGLLSDVFGHYFFDTLTSTEKKLRANDRVWPVLLLKIVFPDIVHQWKLLNDTVLSGSPTIVEQFRMSYISDCNMTAVAGAIIAQVAITGLSLPYLSQSHWVARAFFITSLISGCFAVYFACQAQKTIGTIFVAEDLKNWLTRRGSVPMSFWGIRNRLKELKILMDSGAKTPYPGMRSHTGLDVEAGLLEDFSHLKEWQRSASLWSAFILQAPFTYMKLSLGSFILGLGVYLGFVWTRDLDQVAGNNDSRNVFIIFIIVVICCIYFYVGPAFYKSLEVAPIQQWQKYQKGLDDFAKAQQTARERASLKQDHSAKSRMENSTTSKGFHSSSIEDDISSTPYPTLSTQRAYQPSSSTRELPSAYTSRLVEALEASTKAQYMNNNDIHILRGELARLVEALTKSSLHD